MIRGRSQGRACVVAIAIGISTGACFAPAEATRGLPCTGDAACGPLSCSYGVCGGPTRCEAGAGVGEYCFTVDAREFTVTPGVDALAIGTIDPGALPDIVAGNGGAQTLALLRNLGDGEFAEAVASAPVGFAARELAIGPVDGAGWSDIVATTEASVALVPIVPGADGAGGFADALVLADGLVGAARPQIGQFVDDVNGLADVAVLVADGFDVVPQREIATFGDPVHTALQAATDLRTLGIDASRVYVASGSGDAVVGHSRTATGAFAATTTIDVGPGPTRFALADLDGDAFGDILTAGSDGTLWLTTGRDPSFADPRSPIAVYDLGWAPTTLAAIDLDDDPEPEFLVSGEAPGGRRDVFLFDNDGEGRPIYGGSLGIDDASAVVLADLDLDGINEIIVASQERGTIRVARRAVAPPTGDDDSTGRTTGAPGDSGTDPSSAEDPTVDPTLPTDPTTPVDDTGGVDPCDGALSIGPYCYGWVQDILGLGGSVVGMAAARIDPNAPEFLVAVTSEGAVWQHPGDLGGVFAPLMEPSYFAAGTPSGLAVGTMSLGSGFDEAVIAVSHDGGISAFAPVSDGLSSGEQQIEGGAFAPLIAPMIYDPSTGAVASGLAFALNGGLRLATAETLLDGQPLHEASGTVLDVDAVPGFSEQTVLIAATGGQLELYATSATEIVALGPLVEVPADYVAVLRGSSYLEMVVAGGGAISRVAFDEQGVLVVYPVDQGNVVADFEVGEFDGADGDDLVVMVDEGGLRVLRIYGANADGSLVLLAAFPVEHATAIAVYDYRMPSDLLIAYDDPEKGPYLLHLGTAVAG
jgi:hypothetical protein